MHDLFNACYPVVLLKICAYRSIIVRFCIFEYCRNFVLLYRFADFIIIDLPIFLDKNKFFSYNELILDSTLKFLIYKTCASHFC